MVVASLVTMRDKNLMVLGGLNFDTPAFQSFTKKHAIEPAALRMVQLLASSTGGNSRIENGSVVSQFNWWFMWFAGII